VSVDDEVSLGSAVRGPRQLEYELEMARLRDREANSRTARHSHLHYLLPTKRDCWSCGSDSHLSNSCLYNTFKVPYCNMCGKYHAANVNCAYNSANADVYNAVECDKVAYDDRFIVPCYVNDQRVSALRDSGNNGIVLVDKTLVTAEEIVPDRYIFCRGGGVRQWHGDTQATTVAIMRIRSPRFGYDRDVLTEVGVCSMP